MANDIPLWPSVSEGRLATNREQATIRVPTAHIHRDRRKSIDPLLVLGDADEEDFLCEDFSGALCGPGPNLGCV